MSQLDEIEQRMKRVEQLLVFQAKEMFTAEEAALFMGVGTDHIYRLSGGANPKIGYYKPQGKMKYFLKADLLQYMQQNRTMGASEIETKAKNYLKRQQ